MTDVGQEELFAITMCEISIALGKPPMAVKMSMSTPEAYWYDDHCVALCQPYGRKPDVPFGVAVSLVGEIGGNAHARTALAEYIDSTDILSLAVVGGDESIDPLTRLSLRPAKEP